MQRIGPVILVVLMLLSACSTRVALMALPSAIPDGMDVSGQWRLVDSTVSTNQIRMGSAVNFGSLTGDPVVRDVPGSAVFVFLETGNEVKITQTSAGLFIAFDRAIVEEYRFGELRLVSVGPIQAQRATGFPGGVLTIQTADADGAIMTETYQRRRDELLRNIRIEDGSKLLYDEQRRYRDLSDTVE